jgi:DNA mismatch repair ATPase MutL
VNQIIIKILAHASTEAVYRELLQNSNDADATTAEIYFTPPMPGYCHAGAVP